MKCFRYLAMQTAHYLLVAFQNLVFSYNIYGRNILTNENFIFIVDVMLCLINMKVVIAF